jgi:hypothetical protein
MMILYCTTLLHTCLSTALSLLRRPLVLLSRWLVVACCVASIAGIFAAHPSFGQLLCSPPSLASSRRRHQEDAFDTNVDVSVSGQLASGHRSNKSGGNAIMLTGGRRDESGWQKAQRELE